MDLYLGIFPLLQPNTAISSELTEETYSLATQNHPT